MFQSPKYWMYPCMQCCMGECVGDFMLRDSIVIRMFKLGLDFIRQWTVSCKNWLTFFWLSPSHNQSYLMYTTILVRNLETLVRFFPPQCWFGICSHLSAPKYAWLNIGEGEGCIWLRTKVWRVNVWNSEKIQDKCLLFQRFLTSIVAI